MVRRTCASEFDRRVLGMPTGGNGLFSAVRRRTWERAVMWSYLRSNLAPAAAGARSAADVTEYPDIDMRWSGPVPAHKDGTPFVLAEGI